MERKLAAILSADVQGYSRLMGDDEKATIRTLTVYREVMSHLIQHHHGRVVDSPGDNLLAEFGSAVDAVEGAVAIQHALRHKNADLSAKRQMHYRIGINVGDVVVEGERIYGDGVNIAARLESLADGGGICISSNVYEQVENKLNVTYSYQGEQKVKNIAKPIRVYKIDLAVDTAAIKPNSAFEDASILALPDKPSIAVLPFVNTSNDPEQEYFSDGLTEDLITDLSTISGLFVIARNSVFAYKGQAVDVREVSRKLGVRYVLEGSVRKAGNRVRINAQLIEGTSGGHVWAERYDGELEDIFALQDEITQKIVGALKITLAPEERARIQHTPTENLKAYDAVLRGLEAYRRFTQEDFVQARTLFEQSIALDPAYAEAHAYLSWIHFIEWEWQWSPDPPRWRKRFIDLARRAVDLDDTFAWAHSVLGWSYLVQGRQDQAIAEAERAIVLDPSAADAYGILADILSLSMRPEEALSLIDQAMRLNPHYPVLYLFSLGQAYIVAGRNAEAVTVLKRALTRNPDFQVAQRFLVVAYMATGQVTEAQAEIANLLRSNPNFSLDIARHTWPCIDPAVVERYIGALSKAGLT